MRTTHLLPPVAQGSLTSPFFVINRHRIHFLIGRGTVPEKTCINLLVEGKVVRTANGKDQAKLEWQSWDVSDLQNRRAQIQVLDLSPNAYINVDHIELSDGEKPVTFLREALEDDGSLVLALDQYAVPAKEAAARLAGFRK